MNAIPRSHRPPASARRVQSIELVVFLLILLPLMALSALADRPDGLDFTTVAIAVIVHDLALLALVLFFVWRNGEGFAAIGWSRRHLAREIGIGLALFAPVFLAIAGLERLLRYAGLTAPEALPGYLMPAPGVEYLLALVFLVVVAVAEETIFRGYLLRRFHTLTGSRVAALALSVSVFALGHGYQGSVGIVAVGVLGLVYALIYLWRGSLVAPTVMHFVQNAIGLYLAPLMEAA
ncbi:MAG: CPBP family intramembrane glutamic endopeptidase [Gammaproteobacteria bacterium]